MSYQDLKAYVGSSDVDDTYVESCYNEAVELVTGAVGDTYVPSDVLKRCYLEAGSELYHRRSAPNGVMQFQSFDGSAIRVARDPLIGVYPLIQRYIGWGIG
jgi:hypothetical protein